MFTVDPVRKLEGILRNGIFPVCEWDLTHVVYIFEDFFDHLILECLKRWTNIFFCFLHV